MLVFFPLLLLLPGCASVGLATTSEAGSKYTTVEGGVRMFPEAIKWSKIDAKSDVVLMVDSSSTLQQIEGFGAAFTEAAAWNYNRLSAENKQTFMEMCFGRKGNRYTMGRVPLNSCDFSTDSYSFDDNDGNEDVGLKHFDKTVSRDVKNGMIPLIRAAVETAIKASSTSSASSAQPIKLFGSPWSPPSWMKKGNHSMVGSTAPCLKSDPKIHEAWAEYLRKWVVAYRSHGIDIWGLTAQNEPGAPNFTPWEACTFSAADQRDFIRDYLGPRMEEAGVQLMGFDDQKNNLREWADTILGDPATAKYVWGFGLHWYAGDMFDSVAYVTEKYPQKQQLATEGCTCIYDSVQYNTSWARGARYVHDMIGDLNNGVVGWVDWNLLLDTSGTLGTGGPNHANNTCFAHIHVTDDLVSCSMCLRCRHRSPALTERVLQAGAACSRQLLALRQTLIGDAMPGTDAQHERVRHFSRFIPAGSKFISHSLQKGAQLGVEASVFLLPDGVTIVAVVSNVMGAEGKSVKIMESAWVSAAVVVDLPPRSVVTVQINRKQPSVAW